MTFLVVLWAAQVPSAQAEQGIAQTGQGISQTEQGIAQYRAMLAEDSPAELFEAQGEALWHEPRGPRKASLEQCDLGLGPGVVRGAFVQLPRYFADTARVQDLESRLLTCMQVLQGQDPDVIASTPFGQGEQRTIEALVAWIAAASRGMRVSLPQSHRQERLMYELGRRAFYWRAGPHDFSCATCHGQPDRRIRLQELPDLTGNPGDGVGFAAWPAYRLSSGELWGLQRRLNDCFRQQRFARPGYASEVTIALGVFMGVNARGAVSQAPSVRR